MTKNNINEFIYYEEPSLYDGWICMYRPSDGKTIWRDYILRMRGISEETMQTIKNKLDKKFGNL